MSKQMRKTAEELPAEGRDVSAPSVKSKQAKKDFSPCGNFVSTSGTNPAVLTEEHWQELRNTLPCNMKMEDFIDVLEKISAWVKVAVKEVVAPGFESGLLGVRSSAGICISSSPHEVEHGKTHDSEGWCRCDVASRSSTASLPEPLGVIFDISKDKIFSLIHGEVTRAIMNMLPPETKRYLNMKETISVMSAIVDDSLKQMNSSLREIYCTPDLYESVRLSVSHIEYVAHHLMLGVMTRMLGFLEFCIITSWSSDIRGFPTHIHDELDELLPLVTSATVGATVEHMLSVCSEGTSNDVAGDVSDRPLWDFLQAVSKHISSAALSGKTSSSIDRIMQLLEYSKPRPRSERILESIIFSSTNEDHNMGMFNNKVNTHGLFRMSCETFQLEASKRVSNVIMSVTSELTKVSQVSIFKNADLSSPPVSEASLKSNAFASAVSIVNGITDALRSSFEEDLLKIAHPSTDPALYKSQVQLVSEKVLRSTQANLKDAFVTNLLIRADVIMAAQSSGSKCYNLLLNSKNITKSIIECMLSVLPFSEVHIPGQLIARDFLTSLKERLEVLCMRPMLTSSDIHLEALSDFITVDSFEVIAEKLISSGPLKQNEKSECSWKALESILSIDSLRQSSQELIPIVGNLMLGRIAALDQERAQMSCGGTRSVLSDTDLSNEALQSGIVRSFVKTATEQLLQQCLGLKTCTKPDTASFFERYCFGSPSVREADLEVRQSQQRCCFELSAVIAHTVISDLTGITTSQSEQDHTGSALQKKKSSCRWFRFPRFLKLRFKKWTKKVRFHTEDQVVDKHIPDAPSTSDKTIPKIRRKSLRTRLATAFTKICRKSGESPT
ncbi:uncharacterized protein LOC143474423 isoform X2 [Brachyhypopomus gauderio]|uniref:uncharacterized protein LOC143474423 isoform X2 n=1 Tax=Brachyhypopomus gauderio TaxID=698409 RepID=UPI0040421FDE